MLHFGFKVFEFWCQNFGIKISAFWHKIASILVSKYLHFVVKIPVFGKKISAFKHLKIFEEKCLRFGIFGVLAFQHFGIKSPPACMCMYHSLSYMYQEPFWFQKSGADLIKFFTFLDELTKPS
jgi:hypothetical protein